MEWERGEKERDERKNNIIIKGYKFREEDLKKQVRNFLTNNLKIETEVKNAIRLNRGENKRGSEVIAVIGKTTKLG